MKNINLITFAKQKVTIRLWSTLVVLTLMSCTAGEEIADLAIQNVTVIDAENGVREGQTVVVSSGMITAVQSSGEAVNCLLYTSPSPRD